jgi:hypothetical protein
LPEVSKDNSMPVMCGSETSRLLEKFFIAIFYGGRCRNMSFNYIIIFSCEI